MSAKTVFISYSHQDKDLLGPLVAQLKALEQAGLLDVWVDTRIDAGEKWYPDIEGAMQRAAVAVCLVSEHFLASDFCTKEEVPFLLQRAEQDGLLIIPVLLSDCPWYAHRWVEERQMLPGEGQSVRTNYAMNPAAVFSRVAKRIHDKFKDPAYQPPKPRIKWTAPAPERLDLTRLPETGSALFGRDEELKLLDAAWGDDSTSRTRVLAFTAHGGVGKSTLINHWLGEMKRDNFRGATRVFGWSFYSQGVREQGPASADTFVAAALRFFGDEAMAGSPASAWDKGERLARLVGAERALLVLDGMEPLQSAQAFDRGKLRDPALESLLRGLAKQSAGLCLITTRESLPDMAKKPGFAERDLEQITPQAGRALLRTARVVGTDAELESLAERFGPHALAISLLGVYLHEQPGHGLGPAQKLEQMPGKSPVDRVLAGFEQWLGDSAEREVLRLLGLFDRPADAGCLKALRARPAIAGLTKRVSRLSNAEWRRVLNRLDHLRLTHTRQSNSGHRFLDAHPLLREHFAEQLRNKKGWRVAHLRLYKHLCKTAPRKNKPTLEDLQPLYHAVAHGCLAGRHQDAFRIYWKRIQKENKGYSHRNLGILVQELEALNCFFDPKRKQPSTKLKASSQALVCGLRGARLRSLGRTGEAVKSLTQSVQWYTVLQRTDSKMSRWLALRLRHLTETLQPCGRLLKAQVYARLSANVAESSRDRYQRFTSHCVLGSLLHHRGRWDAGKQEFERAEDVLKATRALRMKVLYSLWGFRFNELLLDLKEFNDVRKRVTKTAGYWSSKRPLRDPEKGLGFLGQVLEQLSGAKVRLGLCEQRERMPSNKLLSDFHRIDDELRRAGRHDFQPYGMLAHTACLRLKLLLRAAEQKITEVWDLALREGMLVFQAECWLESARLFLVSKSKDAFPVYVSSLLPDEYREKASDIISRVEKFVPKTYRRRISEYEELKREVRSRGEGSWQR